MFTHILKVVESRNSCTLWFLLFVYFSFRLRSLKNSWLLKALTWCRFLPPFFPFRHVFWGLHAGEGSSTHENFRHLLCRCIPHSLFSLNVRCVHYSILKVPEQNSAATPRKTHIFPSHLQKSRFIAAFQKKLGKSWLHLKHTADGEKTLTRTATAYCHLKAPQRSVPPRQGKNKAPSKQTQSVCFCLLRCEELIAKGGWSSFLGWPRPFLNAPTESGDEILASFHPIKAAQNSLLAQNPDT